MASVRVRFYNESTRIDHPDASAVAGPFPFASWLYDELKDDQGNSLAYTRHQGQHLGCWCYQNVWYTNLRLEAAGAG
jgi:hypothetical protein